MTDYAEDHARARLRSNRALATGLLLLSGAILIGTYMVPEATFAVLLARAASEAGIVGGLADWFAVSALFRRPLGLPIPHTAIIPRNKDRIAEALGLFVERNFLTEETVLRKLRDIRAAKRVTAWLATPETGASIAQSIATALPYVVRSLDNSDLQRFTHATLGEQLRKADVASVAARALDVLGQTGEADVLFARVAEIAGDWLKTNRAADRRARPREEPVVAAAQHRPQDRRRHRRRRHRAPGRSARSQERRAPEVQGRALGPRRRAAEVAQAARKRSTPPRTASSIIPSSRRGSARSGAARRRPCSPISRSRTPKPAPVSNARSTSSPARFSRTKRCSATSTICWSVSPSTSSPGATRSARSSPKW